MSRKAIHTDKAPGAIGPYSQAISYNNLLFTSGQIPLDPQTGKLVEGNITDQAHRVFQNMAAIAKQAGTSLDKAVKISVFLTDIGDFATVNTVYQQYFKEPFPARSAYQVTALPLGAIIEAEAIIVL